jgi:flap endonuclease-1
VYVFDGKPPFLKSGELATRKARKAEAIRDYQKAKDAGDAEKMQIMADRSTTVTPLITNQTKRLLQLMGVAIVNAPCEAEATCAELVKKGLFSPEVGIEEYRKNLIGISQEFHRNCIYF